MNSEENILNFLDILDLDEEVIDQRLKSIMVRNNHTNIQLSNAIQLLRYKQLINIREETECENTEEIDFLVKLLSGLNEENINNVCTIFNIVLGLKTGSILSNSQHFLTQIWYDTEDTARSNHLMLCFQVCNSILDAVLKSGEKLDLLFSEIPVKQILNSANEKLIYTFLTTIVPKIIESGINLNILEQVWSHIMQSKNTETALKMISWLSDYYLPTSDDNVSAKWKSQVVFKYEFWDLVLQGLKSDAASTRKISIYLAKRAVDYLYNINRKVEVKLESRCVLKWDPKDKIKYKNLWDNFFILLDSLEEKQSNIVFPSLKLFDAIKDIEDCWLQYAFNLGLKHDNTQVKLKCIAYKLKTTINSDSDALVLLDALNDVNLYESHTDIEDMKAKITTLLRKSQSCFHIFKTIPLVKWSPIAFFHLSDVFSNLHLESDWNINADDVCTTAKDILKVPCNIVAVRKAIYVNFSHFIGNCCKHLNTTQLVNLYKAFQLEMLDYDPLKMVLRNNLPVVTKETILETSIDINFILLYINNDNINVFVDMINDKIRRIQNIQNRQYSNKLECLEDVIFLAKLYNKSKDIENSALEICTTVIAREYKTILQYILSLLSNECKLRIEDTVELFSNLDSMSSINESSLKELLLHLYKSSILLLIDTNTELSKTIVSIHILHLLNNSDVLKTYYQQEMLSLSNLMALINNFKFKDDANPQSGRLRNIFYELSTRIVFSYLQAEEKHINIRETVDLIETVIECGGYGCLKWILRIMNIVLPNILDADAIDFNITLFINRLWKEIDELKSNNQYTPCMKEFVVLITQDTLLNNSVYNNLVLSYCIEIVDHGVVKNTPLYYLVKELNTKNIIHGHMAHVLCEILLYSPVPRKDQRIADNLVIDILKDPKYGLKGNKKDVRDSHFNYEIEYLSLITLSRINDDEILAMITSLIINKVDVVFKQKQRYHGNSQIHRFLLKAVQTLLILLLKRLNNKETMQWCLLLLGKLPHQPSVRICLEWYIAYFFYREATTLNNETLQSLVANNIPMTSQFSIMYWVIKHRILTKKHSTEEYEFVMDTLLSHTMGQLFGVRLHAQYLTSKLYSIQPHERYKYIVEVIENTFTDSSADKNYIKLKEEYFANNFDVVGNITPYFIYHFLPRYFNNFNNEHTDFDFVRCMCEEIEEGFVGNSPVEFKEEWRKFKFDQNDDNCLYRNVESKTHEDEECLGTIQKKYIPWMNMSDVNCYHGVKKRDCGSELIVVASLIDKLPNLGGMARTAEVFGVRTYVVDSLARLQDKQFQGLSVSAERWIDVEEVRPGRPLKEYLGRKKAEGYSVVAAEQTSTSRSLQHFKFPKKTLLLLGHEKEGIPCDMLPIMDFCVEIPQQGYVRSLNVHVTAAIFVWEYARQNIL